MGRGRRVRHDGFAHGRAPHRSRGGCWRRSVYGFMSARGKS